MDAKLLDFYGINRLTRDRFRRLNTSFNIDEFVEQRFGAAFSTSPDPNLKLFLTKGIRLALDHFENCMSKAPTEPPAEPSEDREQDALP